MVGGKVVNYLELHSDGFPVLVNLDSIQLVEYSNHIKAKVYLRLWDAYIITDESYDEVKEKIYERMR